MRQGRKDHRSESSCDNGKIMCNALPLGGVVGLNENDLGLHKYVCLALFSQVIPHTIEILSTAGGLLSEIRSQIGVVYKIRTIRCKLTLYNLLVSYCFCICCIHVYILDFMDIFGVDKYTCYMILL